MIHLIRSQNEKKKAKQNKNKNKQQQQNMSRHLNSIIEKDMSKL